MNEREVSWTKLFAFASPNQVKARTTKCACGNGSCKLAKGFVCKCGCKHLNHGIDQRKGMSALDKALGIEKEAPTPLGDLGLNLELSGRTELEGMI